MIMKLKLATLASAVLLAPNAITTVEAQVVCPSATWVARDVSAPATDAWCQRNCNQPLGGYINSSTCRQKCSCLPNPVTDHASFATKCDGAIRPFCGNNSTLVANPGAHVRGDAWCVANCRLNHPGCTCGTCKCVCEYDDNCLVPEFGACDPLTGKRTCTTCLEGWSVKNGVCTECAVVDLVVNGGFEEPLVKEAAKNNALQNGANWATFPVVNGWQSDSKRNANSPTTIELWHDGQDSLKAHGGEQWTEVQAYGKTNLWQLVNGARAGETLTLKFWHHTRNRQGRSETVIVTIGTAAGTNQVTKDFSVNGADFWKEQTLTYPVPAGFTGQLKLNFYGQDNTPSIANCANFGCGNLVDDVSLKVERCTP